MSVEKAKVNIVCSCAFSKRQLKYLSRKFLKMQQLRNFLRIVSSSEMSYEVKFFNFNKEEDE